MGGHGESPRVRGEFQHSRVKISLKEDLFDLALNH